MPSISMNLSIFEVLNRMTGLQITTIPPHHTQLCFLSMYFSAARISSDGFIQMQVLISKDTHNTGRYLVICMRYAPLGVSF